MKNFKNRLLYNIYYFLFWIVYFIFARIFFLAYYFDKSQELGFSTIIKTFFYGLQLDASFAAYISFIPFLLMIFSIIIKPKIIVKIIRWYSIIVILFINLLLLIDAGLYQSWGVRLDTSLLPYLNTPQLMISSASTFQLLTGVFFWILISYIFIKLFNKINQKSSDKLSFGSWLEIPLFFLITAALIIPVRGGFQTIPVNQSNVYFSNKMFANHAAVNFIWNFFNTLTHRSDGTNPYIYFDDETALKIINKTKNKLLESTTDSILNTSRPNVILILWESLPAKIVGSLGGESDVTPNLNKLSKEG
ncbi:MAG: phosphoglycerol transferase MdoB-like AlkP superfamily enzyme, partial [Polaribacter sp.]